MRRRPPCWVWPLCAIAWQPGTLAQAPPGQAARAVVQLLAIGPGANGKDQKCSGTGFVVNKEGIVLTNAHVVREAEGCIGLAWHSGPRRMLAKLPGDTGNAAPASMVSGPAVSCDVIGLDDDHDLALLKPARPLPGGTPASPYPFLSLDVDGAREIQAGQPVWVSGHPLLAWQPVTQSGEFIRRTRLPLSGPLGVQVDVLVLNIPLQPGSSGSPVFLQRGAGVIGVVVGQFSRRPSETLAVPIRYTVDLLRHYSIDWSPVAR